MDEERRWAVVVTVTRRYEVALIGPDSAEEAEGRAIAYAKNRIAAPVELTILSTDYRAEAFEDSPEMTYEGDLLGSEVP